MRIRTIKPSFWTSDDIVDLPDDFTRLLYIGLWNYADDEGRGRDRAALIRAALFPLRKDVDDDRVELGMGALSGAELITRYVVKNRWYFVVDRWKDHQRISKPTGSILPTLDEGSAKPPGMLQQPSIDVERALPEDSGWEVEGKGSGIGNREQGSPAPNGAPSNGNLLAEALLSSDSTAQYLISRMSEKWQLAMTSGALMKLGGIYGPAVLTDALRDMREENVGPEEPYPYLEKVCIRIAGGSDVA